MAEAEAAAAAPAEAAADAAPASAELEAAPADPADVGGGSVASTYTGLCSAAGVAPISYITAGLESPDLVALEARGTFPSQGGRMDN